MVASPPPWNRSPDPFAELISADAIAARVAELGAAITRDYASRSGDIVVVAVLKGSVIFLADLVRHIAAPIVVDFIGISSYGDATVSSGVVQITQDQTRRPASIALCSLLHKPERAEREVKIDYLGFTIPNKFVVGYGLDVAQQYRNLPFIGYVQGT